MGPIYKFPDAGRIDPRQLNVGSSTFQVTEEEIVVVNVPSYHQQFAEVIKTIPPRVQVWVLLSCHYRRL